MKLQVISLIAALLLLGSLTVSGADKPTSASEPQSMQGVATTETAILAGGCFWCMEPPFEKLPGVVSVISGYTGGQLENPSYQQVSGGETNHTEAIEIVFDPTVISYQQILEVFWQQIDPTDAAGQFVDRGSQYRSGIYPLTPQQQQISLESKQQLERSGRFERKIVTEIVAAGSFYPAEEYHQDYYKKNSWRYKYYRAGSGRDRFLEQVWGQP